MKKIIISSYFLILILFSFFSYLFIDPNFIYLNKFYSGFAFSERLTVTIFYILFVLGFFGFYIYFLKLFKEKKFNFKHFKIILFGTICVLFFSYPAAFSYDIFNYIATAKVTFFYHENPYIIMPIDFTTDPLLLFTHAANKVALYGPAWILITGAPFLLGFGNFILTLFNFKLVVIVFYLGISYLILKLTNDPQKIAFFALNPLVLIETLVSSHNDVAMIFFALMSFYFLKKEKLILAIIFIFISILIKYATIFLLPVLMYYFFLKVKKKKINWDKLFLFSSIAMFTIFFLAPFREEIYPWYGIWFIAFVSLILKYKLLRLITILFSFVLLLRYVPFMYLGTYFGPTPVIKTLITFVPLIFLIVLYWLNRTKLFKKF